MTKSFNQPFTIEKGRLLPAKSTSPMPIISPTSKAPTQTSGHDEAALSVDWLPSPNYNQRPLNTTIDAIVIHNISLPPNDFSQTDLKGLHYVKALFTNTLDWNAHPYFKTIEGITVSAHVFIERDGRLTQFVNFEHRAWHAGKSCYLGKPECNDYSIGIELEGSDFRPFTQTQYETLSSVIVAIYKAYPETRRHLTGHSDIAPGRKTDPGEYFDWLQLRQTIKQRLIKGK